MARGMAISSRATLLRPLVQDIPQKAQGAKRGHRDLDPPRELNCFFEAKQPSPEP